MTVKLIIYDKRTDHQYERLHQAIAGNGGARIQQSAWVLNTTSSAAELRVALMRVLDADDRLFICDLTTASDIAGFNLMQSGLRVLQRGVPYSIAS